MCVNPVVISDAEVFIHSTFDLKPMYPIETQSISEFSQVVGPGLGYMGAQKLLPKSLSNRCDR